MITNCCSDTLRNYGPRDPIPGLEFGCRECPSVLRYTEHGWKLRRSNRVYIAAPFPLKHMAITLRFGLKSVGIVCSSRWLDLPTDEWSESAALADLSDVESSSMLIAINPKDWAIKGTGGRHVEFGYAVARDRPIVLIGERTNVFHHLPNIQVVPDLTSGVQVVKEFIETVTTVVAVA